jgi:hypothetical protein
MNSTHWLPATTIRKGYTKLWIVERTANTTSYLR